MKISFTVSGEALRSMGIEVLGSNPRDQSYSHTARPEPQTFKRGLKLA